MSLTFFDAFALTSTDIDGKYTMPVNDGDVLIFSFVGMETQEITVAAGRSVIDVTLKDDVNTLDGVVVIGYGTARKSDLTGAIATVPVKELARQASSNPAQALQGKISGVQVTNTGTPGSAPVIRIRGLGSVKSDVGPLYVVDGVLTNDISYLSNGEIETLSVLKDASASAIYGVRVANGVIIITTKRGKADRPNVTYSGYAGVQKPIKMVELTNRNQYFEMLNEGFTIKNSRPETREPTSLIDPAQYPNSTDWYDAIMRDQAFTQNHDVNVSGGSEATQYSLGAGYYQQDGLIKNNDYKRINISSAVDTKISKYVKVGVSAT